MAGNLTAMIASIFSGSAVTADPYYEYTTLLLPGNGTNGAQNNTFLDGSTNNFTITRNGNTTQGTFSPFSQTGWGNYFSSSGLTAPSNAAFAFGTGQFTFETWFYSTGSNSSDQLFYDLGSVNTSGSFGIFTSLGVLTVRIDGYTNDLTYSLTSSWPNQWHHLAVVRDSSNVLTVYLDGASIASGTRAQNITQNSPYIAKGTGVLSGYAFSGYLSNTRVVKGVAVYTGAFTPPTSPLAATQSAGTNISAITTGQTSLLTCQSNRFIDNGQGNTSNTPFTLTPSGSPTVVAFSPFNPTASWSAATYGGSGYFDGNSDWLSTADNAAFTMGSGDFTIEYWTYFLGGSDLRVYGQFASSLSLSTISFFGGNSSGNKVLNGVYSGTTGYTCTSTADMPTNQWVHIAFVRDGNTLRQYINGVQDGTSNVAGASINDSSTQLSIGRVGEYAAQYWNGYISNFRIVKGSCVYPNGTQFTPPTAPLTAITNTSLLLNFTNAGIYDATSKNDLETVGNAQISTAISAKWGSGSMYFDGTGDYLRGVDVPMFNFQASDFTIEAWIYITATPSGTQVIYSRENATTNGIIFTINSSASVGIGLSSDGVSYQLVLYGGTLTTNAWNYISVVRSGSGTNNIKIYVAGSQVAQNTFASSIYSPSGAIPVVGARNTNGDLPFLGYINDLRITRYARTITTPTAAFPTL